MEERALVLDGNQRAALAAVRSLGCRGLWICVGEITDTSLSGCSRFCQSNESYHDPYESPRQFFDDLCRIIETKKITFLLPITEATTYAVLRYKSELPASVTLPLPDSDQVEMIANKNRLFRLALENGVPVPESIFCNNRQEGLDAIGSVTSYPVVLKPAKSRILHDNCIEPTSVMAVHSRKQAEDALQQHAFFESPFTIQKFVEGKGQGVFALYDRGHAVCFFAHRRLREKPPEGGVSVLCESAPVPENLKQYARTLLDAANWHGVAMVEFRVTPQGDPYLMEINPRFWGSLQLAIDSGVDFPYWLYQITNGNELGNLPPQEHRRVRWLLGDLDRLYLVLKAPFSRYSLWSKLGSVFSFLRPTRKTRHEVNRLSDFRPFIYELKQYLKSLGPGR
ncbi:ATP-grasp domain-containing protein [Marinobacter sp.]|uniref:carboxylate--amine ligase n=1 Tax=Marinobacter sp. TaxID=50741 RepID=UPI00356AE575